jgi:hypothetical protein
LWSQNRQFKQLILNKKAKIVIKYFFTLLFVAYYFSATLFYHSHFIDGKEIVHSHFYWITKNADGEPVKHTHTHDELVTLQIISQFVIIVTVVGLFLRTIQFLLNEFLIPLEEAIFEIKPVFSYSLRGPPFGFSL